jgi:hypothetical protein
VGPAAAAALDGAAAALDGAGAAALDAAGAAALDGAGAAALDALEAVGAGALVAALDEDFELLQAPRNSNETTESVPSFVFIDMPVYLVICNSY